MQEELDTLIHHFRRAQDIGVATIIDVLKIPLPKSGPAWSRYCVNMGLHNTAQLNGIPIYVHGFGIELRIGNLTIDFDWGPNGEPDGFDAWRLYNFTLVNPTGVACTHDDVIGWIESAFETGELIRVDHTYFAPMRRSAVQSRCELPNDTTSPGH